MAEQVIERRGAGPIQNLWKQGVWGAVPPRSCEQFWFKGASNTAKLGYFKHNTKLFYHQHINMTVLNTMLQAERSIRVFQSFPKILGQFEGSPLVD